MPITETAPVRFACLCELWNRGDVVLGVTDALDVDRFRLVVDGCFKILGVVSIDELDADAIFLERHCKIL